MQNAPQRIPGMLFGLYLMLTGFGRFLVEYLSLNPIAVFGLKEAQIVSMGLFVAGASIVFAAYGNAATASCDLAPAKRIP